MLLIFRLKTANLIIWIIYYPRKKESMGYKKVVSLGVTTLSIIGWGTVVFANQSQEPISQIQGEVLSLSSVLSYNKYLNGEISLNDVIPSNADLLSYAEDPYVKLNNDMSLQEGDSLAAHTSELTNNTDTSQILSTASFTYTQLDTVSTKTSHTAGVDMTTTAEMKFPFVSGSMSMSVKYEYNNTNEITSSETKQWEVPAQTISVPAGKTYKLTWVLTSSTASGTVDLTNRVTAVLPYASSSGSGSIGIGDAINEQHSFYDKLIEGEGFIPWGFEEEWEPLDSGSGVRKLGTSTYHAKFGTDLVLDVSDVTDSSSAAKVISRIPMHIKATTIK